MFLMTLERHRGVSSASRRPTRPWESFDRTVSYALTARDDQVIVER
jgi:hypothetical protein